MVAQLPMFARTFSKLGLLVLLLVALVTPAHADRVTPRDTVTGHVKIQQAPDSDSAQLGILQPGEHLEYLASESSWHKVRLDDGQEGFVIKRWTQVIPDPIDLATLTPFAVHFIDVGTGDAAIIDMGDREIIIDGGNFPNDLRNYADENNIIDGPIELLIVTHADADHWKGLVRLLGFDGVVDNPPGVLEFWEPGYDRDCDPVNHPPKLNYLSFIQNVQGIVPAAGFKRPLEDHHAPATDTGQVQSFTLSSVPGVNFTLLHSEKAPTASDCSYAKNNVSVVLILEIDGVRFLFTGDANGKERDDVGTVAPSHVEGSLMGLEGNFPGTLKADVLKVPHHGSETASTQSFIDAVDPDFAIISASTTHHLPKSAVVDRYDDGQRVILRTDETMAKGVDHIVCAKFDGTLDCNFVDVINP